MIPNLPRPFLWTEIKTMKEFLNGDLLARTFYDIFKEIQGSIFLSYVDEVALFNEFYYQLTRYYYEQPKESDYQRYYADIRTNLGKVECADLVMTMMFHYCRIREIRPRFRITPFMRAIILQQENTAFWQYFMTIKSTMNNWFDFVPYPQKPCPASPKTLEKLNLDWKSITQNFDLTTIREILGLWEKDEDKRKVAKMIKVKLGLLILFTHIPKRNAIEYNKSVEYLEDLTRKKDEVKDSSTTSIESLEREVKELKEKNSLISAERDKYKKQVDGLTKELEDINIEVENAYQETKQNNELTKQQIEEIELRIKNMSEKMGKTTIPLTVLVEGLKRYAKLKGLEKAIDLLQSLTVILKKVRVWTENADELEDYFINALEEDKQTPVKFENAQVTMQQPTINGPLNDIHDNKNVNMGGE